LQQQFSLWFAQFVTSKKLKRHDLEVFKNE